MNEKESWTSPLNKLVFSKAVKARDAQVTIRDGRVFNLDYEMRPGWVHVSPAGKHVMLPRGFFDIEKVESNDWLYSGELIITRPPEPDPEPRATKVMDNPLKITDD